MTFTVCCFRLSAGGHDDSYARDGLILVIEDLTFQLVLLPEDSRRHTENYKHEDGEAKCRFHLFLVSLIIGGVLPSTTSSVYGFGWSPSIITRTRTPSPYFLGMSRRLKTPSLDVSTGSIPGRSSSVTRAPCNGLPLPSSTVPDNSAFAPACF